MQSSFSFPPPPPPPPPGDGGVVDDDNDDDDDDEEEEEEEEGEEEEDFRPRVFFSNRPSIETLLPVFFLLSSALWSSSEGFFPRGK